MGSPRWRPIMLASNFPHHHEPHGRQRTVTSMPGSIALKPTRIGWIYLRSRLLVNAPRRWRAIMLASNFPHHHEPPGTQRAAASAPGSIASKPTRPSSHHHSATKMMAHHCSSRCSPLAVWAVPAKFQFSKDLPTSRRFGTPLQYCFAVQRKRFRRMIFLLTLVSCARAVSHGHR